jgi:hypothetical protein
MWGTITLAIVGINTFDSSCAAMMLAIVRDFQARRPFTRAPIGTMTQKEMGSCCK